MICHPTGQHPQTQEVVVKAVQVRRINLNSQHLMLSVLHDFLHLWSDGHRRSFLVAPSAFRPRILCISSEGRRLSEGGKENGSPALQPHRSWLSTARLWYRMLYFYFGWEMSKKGQLKNTVTLTHDTPAVVPLNLVKRLLFHCEAIPKGLPAVCAISITSILQTFKKKTFAKLSKFLVTLATQGLCLSFPPSLHLSHLSNYSQ